MNDPDPKIDAIMRDMDALKENTKEILESIQARKGIVYATICHNLYAAAQEFLVLSIVAKDNYSIEIARSGTMHISRTVAYLNHTTEFAGILDDMRALIERANTDWHSKGHMG